MPGGDDGNELDGFERLADQAIGRVRRQRGDADGEAPAAHGTRQRLGRVDMEADRNGGKLALEIHQRAGQPRDREHHPDADLQLALQAQGEARRAGMQRVDIEQDLACVGEQRSPRMSQRRPLIEAPEQRHAQLALEIGDGIAHRRLGTPQMARRAREAALVDHRQEDAQLVERKWLHAIPSAATDGRP